MISKYDIYTSDPVISINIGMCGGRDLLFIDLYLSIYLFLSQIAEQALLKSSDPVISISICSSH